MANTEVIGRHKVVTIRYSLTNADGVVIRDAAEKPVRYVHGCGLLFPKLETALENHKTGDVLKVKLLPDDAFGKRDLDLVHTVPVDQLPSGEKIAVGGKITGVGPGGEQVVFSVAAVENGLATLDGNNPLAGQTLIFEIEVQGLREATPEEIRQRRALD